MKANQPTKKDGRLPWRPNWQEMRITLMAGQKEMKVAIYSICLNSKGHQEIN
jgi:hypothetical protein